MIHLKLLGEVMKSRREMNIKIEVTAVCLCITYRLFKDIPQQTAFSAFWRFIYHLMVKKIIMLSNNLIYTCLNWIISLFYLYHIWKPGKNNFKAIFLSFTVWKSLQFALTGQYRRGYEERN